MKRIFLINKIVLFVVLIYNTFSLRYEMEIQLKHDELDKFNIINFNDNCDYTIPSLFSPIILSDGSRTKGLIKQNDVRINLNNPIFTDYNGNLYKSELDNSFWCIKQKSGDEELSANCHFGLSYNFSNSTEGLSENEINLNVLNESNNKIFSFDKWNELNNNTTISSILYYGENHDDFIINKGIKGSCNIIENEPYWGCFFDSINFENETISLISNETGNNYNIFFSSENNEIIFPTFFDSSFIKLTKGKCYFEQDIYGKRFCCDEYFDNNTHLDIILSNKDIDITLEIDNLLRYNLNKDENDRKKTNIYFSSQNDIILPLIMFKNFHVQFDAENKVINFFTTDNSILKVKTKEKDDDSSDSNILTIFIVILIIVVIIAAGIGIFYFIKIKCGSNFEKNINKFNKFEDEETDIKPMNEKRVF